MRDSQRRKSNEIEDWNINVTLSKPELAAMDYGQELFAMLASDGNFLGMSQGTSLASTASSKINSS